MLQCVCVCSEVSPTSSSRILSRVEALFLGPLEQSIVDERVLTCALPLVPLLLTQGLQSPVETVRSPVLATISRLVQLPSAPSLLLRSTACASESGAVGEHSSSSSEAIAGAGAGSTLLEQLVVACLGGQRGGAGAERGDAEARGRRAQLAMDVINRALLLLVTSIGDVDEPATPIPTRTVLAGRIIGTLVHRICALLRQPSCSTACRFQPHYLLSSMTIQVHCTRDRKVIARVRVYKVLLVPEHTPYNIQILYYPVSRRCNFNLIP